MKAWWLVALVCAGGCADLHDVFTPYAPNDADLRAVLAQRRPAKVMDAALVLGCPAEPDGSPSPCQECRVAAAVSEWKRGSVRELVFSGGAAHTPAVEADVMAALAEQEGVPADHILRERRALTTWQNLRFATRILSAHGLRTVLVISTAHHLARARRTARFYGLDDARTAYEACDFLDG